MYAVPVSYCLAAANRIQGRDAGCSALCRNGKILAHTIQISIEPASISFSPPGGVGFTHHEEALALAEELVAAMHWTGIANIDMVLDERDGCSLIEVNGRY